MGALRRAWQFAAVAALLGVVAIGAVLGSMPVRPAPLSDHTRPRPTRSALAPKELPATMAPSEGQLLGAFGRALSTLSGRCGTPVST